MDFQGYQLDPFQAEAIGHIDRGESLVVSAPTGAGKTLIAEYVIEQCLERRKQVIYTAPVKALSNQKFRDFTARHGDQVGIVTGDVSINPGACILIMTTEIFRNRIFEDPARLETTSWAVFDEVHYLDDIQRGTVWEESIILCPRHVRFLCLSATVPNLKDIARWMSRVRGAPVRTVSEAKRPVPLKHFFVAGGKVLTNPKKVRRKRRSGEKRPAGGNRQGGGRRPGAGRSPGTRRDAETRETLQRIMKTDGLPCLYFSFSRKRCEQLAVQNEGLLLLEPQEREEIRSLYSELLLRYDLDGEQSAEKLRPLVTRGIAYHHAGMLPTLKEVVERLFTSGLLKLIFTTETFALGINMPARTVVFDELRKFFGTHFAMLRTRDYYQMAGRAGRRGMDRAGFVYSHVDPERVGPHALERMVYGAPEPVISQFNTSYATILNLYDHLGEGLPEIYDRSFHHFQSSDAIRKRCRRLIKRKIELLKEMGYIDSGGVTDRGRFASRIYGYELQTTEFFYCGLMDKLDEVALAVLVIGVIFEPRGGRRPPRSRSRGGGRAAGLSKSTRPILARIHRLEHKYRVGDITKPPSFALAPAVQAWANGCSFDRAMELSEADEGELVRYLRMGMQLLREIGCAPGATQALSRKTRAAVGRLKRDVVDAEKQMRVV